MRNRPKQQLKIQITKCPIKCKSIIDGKLHYCTRSSHGFDSGKIKEEIVEYIDLINNRKDLRKEILNLYYGSINYLQICDYCDAGTTKTKKIKGGANPMIYGKKKVIVRLHEGLGNQMFQYAYARNLQEKGYEVLLSYKNDNAKLLRTGFVERKNDLVNFKIKLTYIDDKIKKKWGFVEKETRIQKLLYELSIRGLHSLKIIDFRNFAFVYNPKMLMVPSNSYVIGFFQNNRFCDTIRQILLKEFTLKKEMELSEKIRNYLLSENVVSIHVRRGDYTSKIMKRNWGLCSNQYYDNAIRYIEERVSSPLYFVFSDDINWVKENIKFSGKVCFINEEEKLQDFEELMLMSKCKHNIIANSTFSWWGAWLNQNPDKIVIGPRPWAKSNRTYFIGPRDWNWISIN